MRGYVLSIWSIIDPLYIFFTRLTYLHNKSGETQILRVRLTKYKGRPIVLSDGTKINKGDILVKIHLHNIRLLKEISLIKSEVKKAKIIYRYVFTSLPGVEQFIRNNQHAKDIKGIIGITLLNKGCERLGFEVIEPSNRLYIWFKWFAFLPIEILSNQHSIVHDLKHRKPKYLFMSTKKLVSLYKK
ncbi:hypothetical protein ACFFHH_00215 [Cytobacillus solani]|uniref:YkoP-like domain-containing protein n=1 Tax=Cytobacillus solani TaxID=1637975 RepID=A0A0Q3QUY2_9BACI|nr:hypothetical protein [Cytobacillus solani]KOP83867.1 hypothetical protein AMS60_00740 [Bacillus sp. FJAT-21945]KQL21809.1 hypothetical protein AN957_05920 [Cytobacillus solani]USK57471.1 hypothetical protein LIS82_05765 [Cytobacillus solani]